MKLNSLIRNSSKDIERLIGENLVSLYLVGTGATNDKIVDDLDFFVIINNPIDEEKINKFLKKNYSIDIRIRTFLLDELKGKKKNATPIMQFGIFKLEELPYIFRQSKLIMGKGLNFKKLGIKNLDKREYLKFQIRKTKRFMKKFRKKDSIKFYKRFFHKYIAYVVRAEIFYKTGKFYMGYEKLANILRKDRNHIIHDIMLIRKKKKKLDATFTDKTNKYLKEMEKTLK